MPQYQVPQFIDMPDKVFGPLTIKQFIFLAVGLIPILLIYKFFKMWVLLVFGIPIFVFTLAMVFYKHNGIPFPKVVASFIRFAFAHKLYIWKKREVEGSTLPAMEDLPQLAPNPRNNPAMIRVMPATPTPGSAGGAAPRRSLEDLAFSVNTKGENKPDEVE